MQKPFSLAVVLLMSVLIAIANAQESQALKPVTTSTATQTFELPSWGNGTPALLIDVPTGVEVQLHKGPDFDVYSIAPSDGDHPASMGIYVGHNPSTDWPRSASREAAKIGSVPVIWHSWKKQENGQTTYHSEVLVGNFFPCAQRAKAVRKLPPNHPPAPELPVNQNSVVAGCGLEIHVFVEGSRLENVSTVASWAATLRTKS
jgi:hypothetical protein